MTVCPSTVLQSFMQSVCLPWVSIARDNWWEYLFHHKFQQVFDEGTDPAPLEDEWLDDGELAERKHLEGAILTQEETEAESWHQQWVERQFIREKHRIQVARREYTQTPEPIQPPSAASPMSDTSRKGVRWSIESPTASMDSIWKQPPLQLPSSPANRAPDNTTATPRTSILR